MGAVFAAGIGLLRHAAFHRHPGAGRDPRQLAPYTPVENDAGVRSRAVAVSPMKNPCVYILASKRNGVLYIGVTSDLAGRMAEHDQGLIPGFTLRYGIKMLVYYEFHADMEEAIRREKQLKEWRRAWKVRLVENMNPEWSNLFDAPADRARP